jgi:dihydrofolate reductase
MTKVVVAMSMSLDGIAAPESADAEGMAIFTAILGWQFPLRSWQREQGMEGGEDSVDSRVWADNFVRFGPQVIGRTMFDYGYPNWGENPPFHAPVFVVTHRDQERISKSGGTSYTFVTGGVPAAVEQARAVADGKDVLLAGGVSIAQQAFGRRAGRRGSAACRAEAGGAGSSAVRHWRGGLALRRDHRG